MGEPKVDQNQLEQIGNYVKIHIGQWIREQNIYPFPQQQSREIELLERMVRVEEGLKNQMELTRQGFESMDKRFIDLQQYMDKRFSHQQWAMGIGFTLLAGLISALNLL